MGNNMEVKEIHKEIDLIQSCIKRMAHNSFLIKGWTVTVYTALLTLALDNISLFHLCIVLLIITCMFWSLDAFFLVTEKEYRKIYSWVLKERPNGNRELLYELNPFAFKGKIQAREGVVDVMCSGTLSSFYGLLVVLVVIILFYNYGSTICMCTR